MKALIAVFMGFFSGFLIYMMALMVFTGGESPSSVFNYITFFGGGVLSGYIMLRGAKTISKVISRGFLIGAAEWLAMIPVGLIFAGKGITDTVSNSGGSDAALISGLAFGSHLVSFLTSGVSIFMTVMCLIGFSIAYLIGREMKPEANTPIRKCPECAELVQADAKKCHYCGANIDFKQLTK